jgi:hypothetical protein
VATCLVTRSQPIVKSRIVPKNHRAVAGAIADQS